ncbi:MAG: hypothetical protein H6581_31150 [Bacteroidia bacterium]|nr:hypothetical protein [Bacteroidia bacterium]
MEVNDNLQPTNRELQVTLEDEFSLILFQSSCLNCPSLGVERNHPLYNIFYRGEVILGEMLSFNQKKFDLISNPIGDPEIILRDSSLMVKSDNGDWNEPENVTIEWSNRSLYFSYLISHSMGRKEYYQIHHFISLMPDKIINHSIYVDFSSTSTKKEINEWLPNSLEIIYKAKQNVENCKFRYKGKEATATTNSE